MIYNFQKKKRKVKNKRTRLFNINKLFKKVVKNELMKKLMKPKK